MLKIYFAFFLHYCKMSFTFAYTLNDSYNKISNNGAEKVKQNIQ